jgi:hypothetical protein
MLTSFNPFTTAASFDASLVSQAAFGYGVARNSHLPGNPYDWCEMNWYFDRLLYPFTIQNVDEQDFPPGGSQLREPDTGSTVTLDQYFDQHVCTDNDRVILKLDESVNAVHVGEHFILVTGKDQNGWQVFDPGYNPANTVDSAGGSPPSQNIDTLQGHINGFFTQSTISNGTRFRTFQPIGLRTYRDISATLSANQGGITFTANSPVELLVIDPQGRSLGNVSLGLDVFQIPKGTYVREYPFADDNGTGVSNGDPTGVKTAYVRAPLTGNYQLVATGTALGIYLLIVRQFGADGSAQQTAVSGVTDIGAVTKYSYSSSVLGTPAVTPIASFQSALADINNSLKLGLIDNGGIANSLSQKIQNAQDVTGPARNNILNAFKSEVNAQSDKHITGIAPQLLLQDADSLISQN